MTDDRPDCVELVDLIAPRALDAVERDEAARIDAHLAGCARCTADLDGYRRAIVAMSGSGEPPPPEVWTRVTAAVAARSEPTGSGQITPIRNRPIRRAGRSPWPIRIGAAAAGIAAMTAVTWQSVRVSSLDHSVHRLNSVARQMGELRGPAAALVDPSATRLDLGSTSPDHSSLGHLVLQKSGQAYLIDSRFAGLPATETYQLWSVASGRAVSIALLGRHPGTVAFSVDPTVTPTQYLVTVEPAGGVVEPTSAPVAEAAS